MKFDKTRPGTPRLLAPLVIAALALAGCGQSGTPAVPVEIGQDTACSLDGMVLSDFAGPKAQIVYDGGEREFFCDTREMFSILLRPEQKRRVVAVYTQDMAKAGWDRPQGHWIDARTAFYVLCSQRRGSMGPTLAAFATEQDARAFAKDYGGKVLPFSQVTPDMADLSGGAVHDQKM